MGELGAREAPGPSPDEMWDAFIRRRTKGKPEAIKGVVAASDPLLRKGLQSPLYKWDRLVRQNVVEIEDIGKKTPKKAEKKPAKRRPSRKKKDTPTQQRKRAFEVLNELYTDYVYTNPKAKHEPSRKAKPFQAKPKYRPAGERAARASTVAPESRQAPRDSGYGPVPATPSMKRASDWRHGLARWKEALFGTNAMDPLVQLVKEAQRRGGDASALVATMMDFELLPKFLYRDEYGKGGESFHTLKTKLQGFFITGRHIEGSLSHAFEKYGNVHWFRGIRNNLPDAVGGTRGGLTPQANMDLVQRLMGILPDNDFSKAIRKTMDGYWELAGRTGVPMAPYVKNYFPYLLRKGLSETDQVNLINDLYEANLARGRTMTRQQISDAVAGMMADEGWLRMKPGVRRNKDFPRRHAHTERMRDLMEALPRDKALKYIETDAAHVLSRYLRDGAERIAYTEKFGAADEKINQRLDLINKQLNEVGLGLTPEDEALFTDLLNVVQRTYAKPFAEGWTKFQRFMIAVNNWAKLGLALPGSLVETLIPFRNRTFASAWGMYLAEAVVTRPIRSLKRSIYTKPMHIADSRVRADYGDIVGEVIGKIISPENMDLLTATHSADIGGPIANAAFLANGLHFFTNMLMSAQIKTFRHVFEKAMMRELEIRAGKLKRSASHDEDMRMLRYYGVDADAGIRWLKEGAPIDGQYMKNEFSTALINYVNDNTLMARGTNQPRWHSNGNLAWLRHLKTYVTLFGNTVAPDMVRSMTGRVFQESPNHFGLRGKNAAAVMGTAAGMAYLAYMTEELLDWWKFGSFDRHPAAEKLHHDDAKTAQYKAWRAMSRWGIGGFSMALAFDVVESGIYNGRGYPDEKSINQLFHGTVGQDVMRLLTMATAAAHGVTSRDGRGVRAKDVARFFVDLMPMSTAFPRTPHSPGADLMNKEDLVREWTQVLRDAGVGY